MEVLEIFEDKLNKAKQSLLMFQTDDALYKLLEIRLNQAACQYAFQYERVLEFPLGQHLDRLADLEDQEEAALINFNQNPIPQNGYQIQTATRRLQKQLEVIEHIQNIYLD